MKSLHVIQSLERRWYFSPLVFSPPSSFAAGANPSGVIAVDLTGNGTSDVVTSNFGAASISVLRGNNNGTFQPPVLYPVGSSPEAIATADFNADGKPTSSPPMKAIKPSVFCLAMGTARSRLR